jgi:hypothetical protein
MATMRENPHVDVHHVIDGKVIEKLKEIPPNINLNSAKRKYPLVDNRMNQQNQSFEKQDNDDRYFTIDISHNKLVAVFNMNLTAINLLLRIIEEIHEPVIINEHNYLRMVRINNYDPIKTLVLQKTKREDLTGLVVNYNNKDDILHIIANDKALDDFKISLESLAQDLENGKTSDVIHMPQEHGGRGLNCKIIIDNSNVVSQLRLYGII